MRADRPDNTASRPSRPAGRRRGLTLVEVVIAMTILAFAVLVIVQMVSAGQAQTYAALHDLRALSLAEAMLEEVVSLPFDDPDGASNAGPESGETSRALFDNADDFHGFTEDPGALADASGDLYPREYQAFTRSVRVVASTTNVAELGGAVTGQTITVTVIDASGRVWSVDRLILSEEGS